MCTRYLSPDQAAIERAWSLRVRDQPDWVRNLFLRARGPFLRRMGDSTAAELVVGQWGLVPRFAKSAHLAYSTVNARFEEIAAKPSYRDPWKHGQRCLIPAEAFDEPCWETGRNVWWRFRRADGAPWGLAGLWNTWVDPATGAVVESYTVLTLHANAHPLLRRMHKPDPGLAPQQQDKRSVVAIEAPDVEAWLHAPVAEAARLVQLTPVERMLAGPVGAGGHAAGLVHGGVGRRDLSVVTAPETRPLPRARTQDRRTRCRPPV